VGKVQIVYRSISGREMNNTLGLLENAIGCLIFC
jgi:hypothetical protein